VETLTLPRFFTRKDALTLSFTPSVSTTASVAV
jgi:hypothetical protein